MTYAEKLRSPKWQKKRLEIMQRDGFQCQLCKDTESTLHVHHKEYKNGAQPWEYDDENFVTYCEACHKIVEANKELTDVTFVSAMKIKSVAIGLENITVTFYRSGKKMIGFYQYCTENQDIELLIFFGENMLADINDLFSKSFNEIN